MRLSAAVCVVLACLAAPFVVAQEVRTAQGGVVRFLDKVSGETQDIELSRGQAATRGRLTILLNDCRYPPATAGSEAYAHLTIRDRLSADPVFQGWMIASSPALSAMDHPRFDVWLLRCITE